MSPKESAKITSAYKDERNKLLGYIRKRIPDRLEAEDILHDVFYQLTVGFNDIRRLESLSAWLYRVADNSIKDHHNTNHNSVSPMLNSQRNHHGC